jgi:hypothetical protein
MSRPDLVKDTTKAVRLLKRFATGEVTLLDLFAGLGKGDDSTIRAEAGVDEACDKAARCTAPKGHEGGCVFDVATEQSEEGPKDDEQPQAG